MKDILTDMLLVFLIFVVLVASVDIVQTNNALLKEVEQLRLESIKQQTQYDLTRQRVQTLLDLLQVEEMEVTGYAPGENKSGTCNDGNITTASGTLPKVGTIAASNRFDYGQKIYVPGYGLGTVEDRGGAIIGNKLDIVFDSYKDAIEWGRQTKNVLVINGHS